jgi:hypothetical protein
MITASQDAGAGWIDRWDEGAPVRFAMAIPDPFAFERECLSVLTGETITAVRPDPTDDLVRREPLRDPASAAPGRRAGRRVRRRARGQDGGRDPAPAERGVHV